MVKIFGSKYLVTPFYYSDFFWITHAHDSPDYIHKNSFHYTVLVEGVTKLI
ncbi:MAG: hypothetical protein HYZ42_01330 [Bacteroidetes bacterium]|nr:hypothetical protein [Bacteroidota bacterium]